jgi:4-amino-4-deoxy-L-arabinose transferase-like glycosyltransferase
MGQAHKLKFYTIAVFLVAFAALDWNIGALGIAAPYVDPVMQIRAQDEAPMVNAAETMARPGADWATPRVAGRLFLYKPPLLIWLAALCIKIFGYSVWSVRLPAVVFGASGIAALFAWGARARSLPAAALASGVLLASPFWQTFSRLCFTDVVCAASSAVALAFAAFDPELLRWRTRAGFAVFASAAILAKSVAGALPFLALILFWIFSTSRPKPRALLATALLCAAFLAPWYAYQLRVHPQWFWAENVQSQLLGTGLHWDRNSPIRSLPVMYYLQRLLQMDPAALLLALAGFAGVFGMRKNPAALLALAWAAVAVAALCAFQAPTLPYLVLVLPATCLAAAIQGPKWFDRPAPIAALLLALFLAKAAGAGQPWSMRPAAPPVPGAAAMDAYAALHRPNALISVDPDDQFYSLTIPLPRVRYAVLDPSGILPRFAPHYAYLGILVDSREFLNLTQLQPEYEKRLRSWGLASMEPIASTITMHDASELAALIDGSPSTDFYLPARWLSFAGESHTVKPYSQDRVFLLARVIK